MMAVLAMLPQNSGYFYRKEISEIDDRIIAQSKEQFLEKKRNSVIYSCDYFSPVWFITDEVRGSSEISFELDEVKFQKEVAPKLGCSVKEYGQAMRVVITSAFGYSISKLQGQLVKEDQNWSNSF